MRARLALLWQLLALIALGSRPAGASVVALRPIQGDQDRAFASALAQHLERAGFQVELLANAEPALAPPETKERFRKVLVFDLAAGETTAPADLGERLADLAARQLTQQAGLSATRVYPSLRRNTALIRRAVTIDRSLQEGDLASPASPERVQAVGEVTQADIALFGEVVAFAYQPGSSRATVGLSLSLTRIGDRQTRKATVEATAAGRPGEAKEMVAEEAGSRAVGRVLAQLLGGLAPGPDVIAVLEGKLSQTSGRRLLFSGRLSDRGRRPLWQGEEELPRPALLAAEEVLARPGLRDALGRLKLARALAEARLADVIVTYRHDIDLPALEGFRVFPLAASPQTRLSGRFEVLAPTAESEVMVQEGRSRTGGLGGWVGRLLGRREGGPGPPTLVAWVYSPFNWVSERELLVRYEPERIAGGRPLAPDRTNPLCAYAIIDVETGTCRMLKPPPGSPGSPEATAPGALEGYGRLEFLQLVDSLSTWRTNEEGAPFLLSHSLPAAAVALEPGSQRAAFLLARQPARGGLLASSGGLGLSDPGRELTRMLAEDPRWSHEIRWSPLGTQLAVACTEGPRRDGRWSCAAISVLNLGLRAEAESRSEESP
jgi:hypothetical protein